MINLIKQGLSAFQEVFKSYETTIENQTTTSVVKDKKHLTKAVDLAEEIIFLVDKYIDAFDEKDKKKYDKLRTNFFKAN